MSDDPERQPGAERLEDVDADLTANAGWFGGFEVDDGEGILERPVPLGEGDVRRARIVIRRKLPGRRLDKYLHGRFRKRVSRTTIQRLIKQGEITVNGRPTKNSYEMDVGDVVDIVFPPPEPYEVTPEDIPLDILYEDDFVLALNKRMGIIIHPARRSQGGTIANALAHYAKSLSHGEDPFRPGIVHRLDKNTTGVLIVAKTDEAHWRLSLQFEQRTTQKTYLAVVHGEPEFDEDVIDAAIGQHPTVHDRYIATGFAERMGGRFARKLGKSAITRYRVEERFGGFSLVRLFPKTGRTHQIRIHMSHIGHPIVGDPFYGGRHVSRRQVTGRPDESDEPAFTRQMLHARRLVVQHPIRGTPLELEAPLPPDLSELLSLLRSGTRPGRR
ncbi:MAG: RluA family pseudouridine synthase [Phycisphaerae bacterium]